MVMMTDAALASCFVGGTALPDTRAALAAADHGQAGRDLMAAVLKGDVDEARRRLRADPALKTTRGGPNGDLLSLAIARCDKPMVAALLDLGVPPDGKDDAIPLSLALRAADPAFATQLLAAGASPQRRDAYWPLKATIGLNSLGATRLLLQHGAKVDAHDATGATPLRLAVEQQNFRIAELLLEKGADPWAVGSNGETVGTVLAGPVRPGEPEEQAARPRVLQALKKAGWIIPGGPDARQTRRLVLTGAWPPPEARAAGWKTAAPDDVTARMRRFWTESGDKRPR
ncbi:hypothetical protein CFHF_06570 [Caulobacter flavus]|uniref:Uncharacterized protein n=2 Tax=Caulobacter flavus TaxID=1679497 RepID=A0A2N5CX58_9CAUL|nr:hypothetical protein C1707_15570 [Caulobacter flavus]PLR18403.1 hypothetical protein CFHF_06570 [Caulobacter flavus]